MVTVPSNALLPKVTPVVPAPSITPTVKFVAPIDPIVKPPVESLLVIVPVMIAELLLPVIVFVPPESAIVNALPIVRAPSMLSVVASAPRRVTVPSPRAALLVRALTFTLSRVKADIVLAAERPNCPEAPESRLSVREPLVIPWPKVIEPLDPSVIVRAPLLRFKPLFAARKLLLNPSVAAPLTVPLVPSWKSPATVMVFPEALATSPMLWVAPIAPPLMTMFPVPRALPPLAMTLPALSVKPPV